MTTEQATRCANPQCERPRNTRLSDTHCCRYCEASEAEPDGGGVLHAVACRDPALEARIARYRPPMHVDPTHAETYRSAVEAARQWVGQPDAVPRLRTMYAESWQAERHGELRQPTYRRGLVHVVAGWLSELASREAGEDVTVSPKWARRVLENAASGLQLDPDVVISYALARRGDPDELGDNE